LFVNLVCSANIAYSRALSDGIVEVMSEGVVRANRAVWELASQKHVREYDELLEEARTGESLAACEREILEPVLRRSPLVVHLQSGHGLDDITIVRAGARRVVGVDYSQVAASAATRRARELGVMCDYVVAELPPAPQRTGCADLVYTGKGALIWMPDIRAWARRRGAPSHHWRPPLRA
jgi:hypothetical protein